MEPLLQLIDVSKRHEGRPVLRGINLEVMPGEVLGLIGENGVGKSTLMNLLAGAYPADSGEALLDGVPLSARSQSEAMARGVGMIRQDLNVNPRLTVAQAIFRTGRRSGLPHEEVRDEAAELLAANGFGLSVDARLGSLSSLERVLVELGRMAVEEARLVLLDEVGALFARPEIEVLHDVLERFGNRGVSCIYVTHRLSEMKRVADRVAVLKHGRIETIVNTADVEVQDLAALLLTREQLNLADRSGHVQDEVALQVRELHSPTLEGISFDLRRGEVLGLTGPVRKGGMHRLAEALSGRSDEDVEGERELIGSDGGPRAGISYFSTEEQFGFDSTQTVAGFLGGEEKSQELLSMREIIQAIQEMHITVGSARAEVRTLSGGDRQKVALRRWMHDAPQVIILNHPTRGLDVRSRQDLHQMVHDHTEAGGSVILLSADPTELRDWCDRIALMRDGRLVEIVDVDEVDDEDLDLAMVARPARAMALEEPASDDAQSGGGDADGFETRRGARFLVG